MDKRFKPLSLPEQMALRRQAIEDVLAHPEWTVAESVRYIRTTLRLTVPEFARLAGVSVRTLLDIEAARSTGTVQTLERLLGVVGLRLGVQRKRLPGAPDSTMETSSA
ncbi:MAG: transcriptional regulator [Gammaproteobacteria bacterium]|uniref:helix-turn-helix domain-containing protein n=1 Tax=Rhodoferax sp. TaxID=50421 RepID=UPI00184ACCE6|nr:transcriptional regulator [Rhodoferax sp.]MBU3897457.1 transcriptional regulator [Gammaproteobacteria bacterium]MBA3056922.1 transcriptional regulator [Rhodoferax sp.]MBU3998504.1 transcriptional regulator [Gammaproteobacteria bacterium]MBU4018803.1 transcriptional regulator [Gammaproteobacteria bacterium]MBU4079758.1 transcriptional regulator [Gammaproteobacteria bacterium]